MKEQTIQDNQEKSEQDTQEETVVKKQVEIEEPVLYKVILHNDNHTPVDFVVAILERFFHKTQEIANELTMQIHKSGTGVCGIYPYEIAETKVSQVIEYAREHEYPLRCTMDKV